MLDLSQFTSVGGLAVLLVVIIQFLKTSIGSRAAVPWVSVALGIVLMILFNWVAGNVKTPAEWVSYGFGGFVAGLTATGGYEATVDKIKGIFVEQDTPSTPATPTAPRPPGV